MEFDWGEVKIYIKGTLTVLTLSMRHPFLFSQSSVSMR